MKGSCLCEKVQYEINHFKGNVYQCHCQLCRIQGGSSSNTGTIVSVDQLHWIQGQDEIKTWTKDSGFTSSFCSHCGAPVPNILRNLDYYWVPVGTLEDGDYEIVASLYLDSKASWSFVAPKGVQYETMPKVNEFIDLLNGIHGR